MSYQTSIHFDPTALLIIKNEVDNSIKLVESAVSALAEDQTLPFGIDDALNQFEQCAQVLALIDMPQLARIAQYSAELMRKIMANPSKINTQDMLALSEGTTMLKRYIEFICLREVTVPQFLHDTLNRLELALGKALTNEGQHIEPLLDCVNPNFQLPQAPQLEKSGYVHQLYKLCLHKLLQQQAAELDRQGIKLVGTYLAGLAQQQPSEQYWNLVYVAFNHIDELFLNDARLRAFIQIEYNMAQFFAAPSEFKASLADSADVLSLCISQEDEISHHIREQLNIAEDSLTDTQLRVFSTQLYGPDYDTIRNISTLVTTEMAQIRNEIEYNYQNMSPEKTQELQGKLKELANIFKVLDLHDAYHELCNQAAALTQPDVLHEENFAHNLMNAILSAMNAIGILERRHTSSRLQLPVNNMKISLDRLDEAHVVLLTETQSLIELCSQSLVQYLQDQDVNSLTAVPAQLKEVGGAILFLGAQEGQNALLQSAIFIQQQIEQQKSVEKAQINLVLDTLASAEMLIENLKNKQPVLHSMFDVALSSSQQLASATI